MRTHVDWITFTMPMMYGIDTPTAYADAVSRGFLNMFGENLRREVFGGDWVNGHKGRAPYSDSWILGEQRISLFSSPTLSHCCVEISGKGCESLIQAGNMEAVLDACHARVTRIDIACDIETDVKPLDFVSKTSHERMRTSGHYISETGETCYVGSQKSDRFARVYRYNEPHPRAALLRVEHVFRREQAKIFARLCTLHASDTVAKTAGDAFGWCHSDWTPDSQQTIITSMVTDTHKGNNTVFWLVDTVAPCFQRLCREGVIKDPEQFIVRYFLVAL